MSFSVNFEDGTYESTDGSVSIPLNLIPASSWVNALNRALDHVFGNEAISKVSTAKKKADNGELTDEQAAEILAGARNKYREDIIAGTWGVKGQRAARMPSVNRLDAIFNAEWVKDVKAQIAKMGLAEGSEKNTYVINGAQYTFDQIREAYLSNKVKGEARRAELNERAASMLAIEKARAEARKAEAVASDDLI